MQRARRTSALALAAFLAACGEPDPAESVDPQALVDAIRGADRLVVFDWNRDYVDGTGESLVPVYETRIRDDIDQVAEAIRVVKPGESFWCMCNGSLRIRLEAGGVWTGTIDVHHVQSISFTPWGSHAKLADPEALLRWFDAHGVAGPRAEWDRDRAIDAEWTRHRSRWVEAMPTSLRAIEEVQDVLRPDVAALRSALAAEHAAPTPRIRALLGWYGSGTGGWSGVPAYEDFPALLLMDASNDQLVAALESAPLSEAELEGLSRFVCSSEFHETRPGAARALPIELRDQVRAHVLRSDDEYKMGWLRAALGGD